MKIETKFNIGDWVFILNNGKVDEKKVWRIEVSTSELSAGITYVFF